MAEIKEGILGGVNGSVGTVVGITWRGRNFLRSKPRKSNKPATDKQRKSRTKLSVVSTFASKLKGFVNEHCPPALLNGKWATGKEQLISRLIKEGVAIIDEDVCIDAGAVVVSMGMLPPSIIKKISRLKTGRLKVLWDNNITNILAKGSDELILVAYSEQLDAFTDIRGVGMREDKYVHFDLPDAWTEGNIHFWSVWKSKDGKLISTSAYHGITELTTEELPAPKAVNKQEHQEDKQPIAIPDEIPAAISPVQKAVSTPVEDKDISTISTSIIAKPSYIKVKTLPPFLKQSLESSSDSNSSLKQQPPIYADEFRSILEAYQKKE
ncbi:MAG: DUF6266 family protein [Flavobacteriaceae bacterium]|jgi:hypothetical protein|nr:DUF6266 family protein [Flavobacteriaceae bacterium]